MKGGIVRLAAAIAVCGFLAIAAFQLALAAGVPWGAAAWGGAEERLSAPLRAASAGAAVWLVGCAAVAAGRVGWWGRTVPFGLFKWGIWLLAAQLAFNTLANFASASPWERWLMGPWALALSAACLVVAASGRPQRPTPAEEYPEGDRDAT